LLTEIPPSGRAQQRKQNSDEEEFSQDESCFPGKTGSNNITRARVPSGCFSVP
jgi:hypothetical protein